MVMCAATRNERGFMPRSRRRTVVGVIGLWLALVPGKAVLAQTVEAAAPASAATASPVLRGTQHRDMLRLLDLWLEAQRVYDRVPALSAGVVIGPELVWQRGYGSIDGAAAPVPSSTTLYSVCSISKLFTSIAVMQLWEAGKLSLDDDVARHVPAFAIQRRDADSGPITLRALLTHSAGVPREADLGYWSAPEFRFPARQALYERVRQQRTLMRAQQGYQYSNLGMAVLGDVVAAVSGQPYERFVYSQILAPLGMTDTQPFTPELPFGTRAAVGFGALQRDGSRERLAPFDTQAMLPAAGYASTVQDLARLASWQLRLLKSGGSEVLRVATLREMHRVQWISEDRQTARGFGFSVQREQNQTVVGHDGLCPGYRTAVALVPGQSFAVIALANAIGNTGLAPYTGPMRRLVAKGLNLPVAAGGAGKPSLPAYAGRYVSQPWTSEEIIVPWGEGLAMLQLPSSEPASSLSVLRHVEGDRFRFVRDDGLPAGELLFERDVTGQVSGYRWAGSRVLRLAPLPDH
jgi:CubicO group peptidase (beta-lactamase class C family)